VAAKQYEREELRKGEESQREQARTLATIRVLDFEDQIKALTTIHKDCGPVVDWQAVSNEQAPPEPRHNKLKTPGAQAARHSFRPGFFAKLFGRVNIRVAQLDAAIEAAQVADEKEYQEALVEHANDMKLWEEEIKLAKEVLSGDLATFEKIVGLMDTFEGMASFGTIVRVATSSLYPDAMSVELTVSESDIVPAEVKTLTTTG